MPTRQRSTFDRREYHRRSPGSRELPWSGSASCVVRRAKRRQQRPQLLLIWPPTTHGRVINGLPDLGRTGRPDSAPRFMKRETYGVPFETAMRDDPTCLPFRIGNNILIPHFKHHSRRQDPVPMLHYFLIGPVVTAQFGEVVA